MKNITTTLILLFAVLFWGCSGDSGKKNTDDKKEPKKVEVKKPEKIDPMKDEGVGPVKGLKLDANIDQALVKKGAELFKLKCTACHKPYRKFIGPDLAGVTERRTPSWIMNMILDPDKMVKNNEIAKKLLMDFNGSPMANQNLTQEEARAILEYFRTLN